MQENQEKQRKKRVRKVSKVGRPKKPKAKLATERLSFRLTKSQVAMLKMEAEAQGRTLSGHVAWIIKKHLEAQK